MKPTRLPSVPPIQMTGGRTPWRKRAAVFIEQLARLIAGH